MTQSCVLQERNIKKILLKKLLKKFAFSIIKSCFWQVFKFYILEITLIIFLIDCLAISEKNQQKMILSYVWK